jgi:ElaB/YqjD/DUF883 family membrane-anchored ribosome-binding protein
MTDLTASQADKLLAELRAVVNAAEEMLAGGDSANSPAAAEQRGRLRARLQAASEKLGAWQDTATARAREAGKATEAYVQEHPWKAIGIAGAAGVLIGALIARR